MNTYSINTVEQLTGIKAHTLRIWEKRYKNLEPHRTETKIRYYDDEQLKKLLNVATLLEYGYKTSKILALNDDELNASITALVTDNTEELYTVYVNTFVSSMLSYDEVLFDKTFSTIFTRYGVYQAMLNIIYPFLKKTGILWATSNAIPAQEHFASNIVRRKLLAAIDGLAVAGSTEKTFLLFLAQGQRHEIGLLLADYMLRKEGHKTIYLGADVPFESIKTSITDVKPTHLLTFLSTAMDASSNLASLMALTTRQKKIRLIICTNKKIAPENSNSNFAILDSPEKLFDML